MEIKETTNEVSAKRAELVICNRNKEFQKLEVTGNLTIGCKGSKDSVDVEVNSCLFADVQGKLLIKEEGIYYEDVSGRNNTYLNDIPFSELEDGTSLLKDGDILRMDKRADGHSHEQAIIMIFKEKFDVKEEWRTTKLDDKSLKLHISRHEESAGADEVIGEGSEHELPRHYATLSHKNKWKVEDHNTLHGVYVNNCKIDQESLLHDMDVIRIGNTDFLFWGNELFYNHKETSKNKLVIHIEERSVWNLFRKHVLLEDINLSILPGEMVLVLGGSGAGKTTFVNAVMGYEKAKGSITEGDRDIYKDYNQMKYEIGFVPQQDLLRMEDSVYDTLANAAQMRMPKNTTDTEMESRIQGVLEQFGLDREEKAMVSKLSGGQRKRLSIAVEFISNPSLFFLDEPDSGLDGVMARFLMESLRKIADEEKIVIVITHSPDRVADLFDKVIVLAKSKEDNVGHLAFYGSIPEARTFFECDSLEGIIKRINREDEGGEGLADDFIKKYEVLENR